jgi:hypothetical protein
MVLLMLPLLFLFRLFLGCFWVVFGLFWVVFGLFFYFRFSFIFRLNKNKNKKIFINPKYLALGRQLLKMLLTRHGSQAGRPTGHRKTLSGRKESWVLMD